MELRQLRYFLAVAHELNFTRAAEKLRIAQPALSRQIKQLEAELGIRLFDRDQRNVHLTEAGARFRVDAEQIIQQVLAATNRARSGSRVCPLRIGYVWGLFHSIVPPMIERLRRALPEVAITLFDMSATQQSAALVKGNLDAGFIGFAHEADAAGLCKQKVGTCDFRLALPAKHPVSAHRVVDLGDLATETFLVISDEHFPGASRFMTEACGAAGFRPRTTETPERGHTILSLVGAGCGVALLPAPLESLPHHGVVFRPLRKRVKADLHLAWKEPVQTPGLRALLDFKFGTLKSPPSVNGGR